MRATVQYGNDGSGAISMQARSEPTPQANADSEDKGWERVHMVQLTGDMLAGRLDGRTPEVQGAP